MSRCALIYLLACLVGSKMSADQSFDVFAPDRENGQLVSLSVLTADGQVTIEKRDPIALPFDPANIALHPKHRQLIVTSGSHDKAQAITINVSPQGTRQLGIATTLKRPSGYISVDRRGRFLLSAHYRSGSVSVHRIDESGNVREATCSLNTPKTEAHCVLTTPDNRFVYVPCVKNNNALFQYAFDEQNGKLQPLNPINAKPPAMFGPRHVAYHPNLPIAYFSNEQQLGVSVYKIQPNGQLNGLQHAMTIPRRSPYESGKRDLHASDLVLSDNSQWLFVAVRDFNGDEDSVFTFRIESDGRLSQRHRTKVGDIPWKLCLSPCGNYVLVSEAFDRQLNVLEIQHDGSLVSKAIASWNAEIRDMAILPRHAAKREEGQSES